MIWSDLRNQTRRLILDAKASPRWSDEQLLDFAGWALDQLSAHTALITSTGFVADGINRAWTLPDNVYEPISQSGAVFIDDSYSLSYLNPVHPALYNKALNGYYLLPENVLNFLLLPPLGAHVIIQYFAYYPHPLLDSDPILAPGWSSAALSYRMAAYAFTSQAAKTANIKQWDERPSTGDPLDNPLEDQAKAYLKMWDYELALIPRQERGNYFRETFISGIPKH